MFLNKPVEGGKRKEKLLLCNSLPRVNGSQEIKLVLTPEHVSQIGSFSYLGDLGS